ncbi:MAG: hypothetical protein LAN64_01915 [Acidobacteriia bacterium]|nr:hypothetical protein [Terriglobia bacterium]
MLLESSIRGLHATGYTDISPDSDTLRTVKESVSAAEFIARYPSIFEEPSSVGLFHNRYSTSGDHTDKRNNQPLENGLIAIAHNGIISQATPAQYGPQYGLSNLATANDSEILLLKIAKYLGNDLAGAVRKGLTETDQIATPVFALVILDHQRHLVGIRDDVRPLYKFSVPSLGLTGFCSTADIFRRAALAADVEGACGPLNPLRTYSL